jgi:transcriptional regulator with XRE-family HTH domain
MKGKELRETREAARVTQAEVAAHLGISRSRLCHIEAGVRPITPEQFHKAMTFVIERKAENDAKFAAVTGGSPA